MPHVVESDGRQCKATDLFQLLHLFVTPFQNKPACRCSAYTMCRQLTNTLHGTVHYADRQPRRRSTAQILYASGCESRRCASRWSTPSLNWADLSGCWLDTPARPSSKHAAAPASQQPPHTRVPMAVVPGQAAASMQHLVRRRGEQGGPSQYLIRHDPQRPHVSSRIASHGFADCSR